MRDRAGRAPPPVTDDGYSAQARERQGHVAIAKAIHALASAVFFTGVLIALTLIAIWGGKG